MSSIEEAATDGKLTAPNSSIGSNVPVQPSQMMRDFVILLKNYFESDAKTLLNDLIKAISKDISSVTQEGVHVSLLDMFYLKSEFPAESSSIDSCIDKLYKRYQKIMSSDEANHLFTAALHPLASENWRQWYEAKF